MSKDNDKLADDIQQWSDDRDEWSEVSEEWSEVSEEWQLMEDKIGSKKSNVHTPHMSFPTDELMGAAASLAGRFTQFTIGLSSALKDAGIGSSPPRVDLSPEVSEKMSKDSKELTEAGDGSLAAVDDAVTEVADCREDVINCLEDVAKGLDEQKLNVHISKTSFASAGVAGGAAALTGLVLAPFTAGMSLALTAAGVGLSATGVAGGIGTSITDSVLTNMQMQRANQAIEKYNKAVGNLGRKVDSLKDTTKDMLSVVVNAVERNQSNFVKLGELSEELVTTGKELVKVGISILVPQGAKNIVGTVVGLNSLTNAGERFGSRFSVLNIDIDIATIVKNSLEIQKKTPHETAEKVREIIRDIKVQGR